MAATQSDTFFIGEFFAQRMIALAKNGRLRACVSQESDMALISEAVL